MWTWQKSWIPRIWTGDPFSLQSQSSCTKKTRGAVHPSCIPPVLFGNVTFVNTFLIQKHFAIYLTIKERRKKRRKIPIWLIFDLGDLSNSLTTLTLILSNCRAAFWPRLAHPHSDRDLVWTYRDHGCCTNCLLPSTQSRWERNEQNFDSVPLSTHWLLELSKHGGARGSSLLLV